MSGVEFCLLELSPGSNSDCKDLNLGSLALITLNDPKKNGNALDIVLLRSLIQQLQDWRDCNIRAVILRSSSDIAFSVGMDLTMFQQYHTENSHKMCNAVEKEIASLYRCCLNEIYQFPAPVFCLLEKAARAGGVGFAMAADLIIASTGASLTLGEALFGLIPANVMPYLRKRINERRANQMVFIPEPMGVDKLLQWGLVDIVTDEIEKTLKKLLRNILRCSATALAKQKVLGCKLNELHWAQQQNLAEETLAFCLQDPKVELGITAFLAGGLGPWTVKPPTKIL